MSRRRYQPDWPTRLPASRRRLSRLMLILSVGILLSILGGLQLRPDADTPASTVTATTTVSTRPSSPATTVPGTSGAPTLERRSDGWYLPRPEAWPLVSVERVIDGDTLDVRAASEPLRVRIFGIDAPERGERCDPEATTRLAALAGTSLRLVADARQQDGFGRELRYLFTPDGRSIDAALLDEGFVRAWREDGALRGQLVSIEDAAKVARRGCLWSASGSGS